MICPECKSEYVPGVTICPDCGVDLVESLAQETAASAGAGARKVPAGSPLVAVFATSDPGLMAVAETMLESAGVPVAVQGGTDHGFFGSGPLPGFHGRGRITLLVSPRDADDARGILADLIADVEGR